jgi:hypothetical protein
MTAAAREARRLRRWKENTRDLDPRMLVIVPENVEPTDAILQNVWKTGYTGGCVLFFEGL